MSILSETFSGAFDFYIGLSSIIYAILLVVVFFVLQAFFIYLYYKIFMLIKGSLPFIKNVMFLGKEKFNNVLFKK